MRTLKISLLVFILSISISSQVTGWFWQNPLPQGNDLTEICSIDTNTSFAVGWCGMILKTTDGGENWNIRSSGITDNLLGISFCNTNTGIAVGNNGIIIKTTNGGEYWYALTSNTNQKLQAVKFINQNVAFIVGSTGTIMKTSDGGNTWIFQSSGTTYDLYDVYFIDDYIGFIVGSSGRFLKTSDGGNTWIYSIIDPHSLRGLYFFNSSIGIVVGLEGAIFRTTDGGTNWSWQGKASDYSFSDIDFINEYAGVIAGADYFDQVGKVLKTTDGGISWTFVSTGDVTSFFKGVSLTDTTNGLIVGPAGTIIRSTDGGNNWFEESSGTRRSLNAISFSDEKYGTAVGASGSNNTILRTNDGGLNWYSQTSNVNAGLLSVTFTDKYNGTAVGGDYEAIILRTSNGGTNWITQYFSETEDLHSVSFIDSCIGTAVGYPGKILKTIDAGQTWQAQSSGTTVRLRGVTLIDAENGFIVGDGGIILKTTNGGSTWTTVWNAPKDLNGVSFRSRDIGFAVGDDGLIIKTIDYGQTWTSQQSGVTNDLYSVAFSSPEIVTVVGGYDPLWGFVLHTTNGGDKWSIQLLTSLSLRGVSIINDSVGYICGKKGTILKTMNAGIVTEVEELTNRNLESEKNFSLSQNYPNPFNPVTKIKYQIPGQAQNDNVLITLKVYDLLGREIATLVNEEKPVGEYEIEFNGTGLPSGIYLYQLTAENFRETKKMILLK